MSATGAVVAVDLGASSGRIFAGVLDADELRLHEVHRFPNGPVEVRGHLCSDILHIWEEVRRGLVLAARAGEVASVGVDSWAVDFGLVDADGDLLGNPLHYRDGRHALGAERARALVDDETLFARSGIAPLPFLTAYQLVAASGSAAYRAAHRMLLIPDLLTFWMTGEEGAELTNASTTGLVPVGSSSWDWTTIEELGLRADLFPAIRQPAGVVAPLQRELADSSGLGRDVMVVAVGSHDTAAAVAGIPAEATSFAYVVSGTWSLVGLELEAPVCSEAARLAGFTNERGLWGTTRFLRNVTGHWLVQESVRTWERRGATPVVLDELLRQAAREPGLVSVVDVDDPALAVPGDMPSRIASLCRASGQPEPGSRAALLRCVLDSLALAHRRAIRAAAALAGTEVEVVHLVGGGSRNELLCQLTADACGLPVIAGPAEASALGNGLAQAAALGLVPGDRSALRRLAVRSVATRRFEPSESPARWDLAERRLVEAARSPPSSPTRAARSLGG